MNKIIFNNTNSTKTIQFFDDKFYFEIKSIKIIKIDDKEGNELDSYLRENNDIVNIIFKLFLKYERKDNGTTSINNIPLTPNMSKRNMSIIDVDSPVIINNDIEFPSIDIIYTNENKFDVEIEVNYVSFKEGNIENPWIEFQDDLSRNDNSKILFSAPFGAGKTTFLKTFFKENEKNYKVFHLFPVNYSVASNSDIFEYIKFDILYKLLLDETTEFDKENFSKILTSQVFTKNHLLEIFLPFLKIVPKIGGVLSDIAIKLDELKKKYDKYHSNVQIDDKQLAKDFINTIIEKTGGLYEDNFYTQLIKQLLDKIKQTNKQTVLIIDDLDRMDPEHIFRILNVFAAQFDSEYYQQNEYSNKFGFTKIIIVTDFNNLIKVFKHRYGEKTDYTGYLNKFYSNRVHFFNNVQAIVSLLPELTVNFRNNNNERNDRLLHMIITDFAKTGNFNLRDFLKLKQNKDLKQVYDNLSKVNFFNEYRKYVNGIYDFFSIFLLFKQIFDWDNLSNRLSNCSAKTGKEELSNFINNGKMTLYLQALQPLLANEMNFKEGKILYGKMEIEVKYMPDEEIYTFTSELLGIKYKQEFYEVLNKSFEVFESLIL